MSFIKKSKKSHDSADTKADHLAIAYQVQQKNKRKGMVDKDQQPRAPMPMAAEEDEMGPMSMTDIIRSKKKKAFAEGGMVEIEENSEENPNEFDDLNEMAAKKELYDVDQLSDQPMESNEHGDADLDMDENDMDMISRLRSRMKARRGF